MQIRLDMPSGLNVIRAYARGQVTINQEVYRTSLLVTPERLLTDWPPEDFAALEPAHFERIAALEPEIVLIGTGARLRFLPDVLVQSLARAGINFEAMDTGAACRTYNVLMAEGRRVLAALLMIESETE
jgi:uncharacterized protein